ncbi:hypothetical protein [Altericista sp. CCNU0014]|uniref:hypothetical protein n=1 Tax=Altericista sp. CCNU0014 TaxID=3082949 RepID=UPI00384AC2B9
MGGLIAASHSLRRDTGIASVVMLLKRMVLHEAGRFYFMTARYRRCRGCSSSSQCQSQNPIDEPASVLLKRIQAERKV